MRFWSAIALNRETGEEERFCVAGPKHNTAKTVKDTLMQVHPEWSSIKLRRAKKPGWWSYGEN